MPAGEELFFNAVSEFTAQIKKFSIKDFFSKCDQIGRKLRIWSHLLKKNLNGKLHFLCCDCLIKVIKNDRLIGL